MLWVRRALTHCQGSRSYKRGNIITVKHEILKDLTEKKEIDWAVVRKDLLSNKTVSQVNIDGLIVGSCFQKNRLDIAKSYMDYLKSESLEMNDAAVGKLLNLIWKYHTTKNLPLTEEYEEEIIKYCDLAFKKHKFIDSILAESMIHALTMTRQWEKSIKLLDHIQVTCSPGSATISCIIGKAVQEGKLDIAFKYVEDLLTRQVIPHPEVILKLFAKLQDNDELTERLLNLLGDYNVMLPEKLLEEFATMFRDRRDCKFVKINGSGKCSSCNAKLPSNLLGEEEFKKLSSMFYDDVIVRKDVFLKTNPDEVNRYINFVEKFHPFDCVIDGLNVAFSHGQKSRQVYANNVSFSAAKLGSLMIETLSLLDRVDT